CLQSSNWPYIF
nr:immunoglobulin light chain junction region [Macaca mulatta]MOW40404.1 immunoglobulin light chain junction region [Macaca mulatta]